MLVSTLDHLTDDPAVKARFDKAFAWIAAQDLEALEPGRHDIDGDEAYANVFEFDTMAPADKNYEAHRRYADIHYLIRGEELIQVAPVSELEALQDFDEADDFALYADGPRANEVVLHPGEFCVTPPEDAHKPGCAVGDPAPIKKICLKVLVA